MLENKIDQRHLKNLNITKHIFLGAFEGFIRHADFFIIPTYRRLLLHLSELLFIDWKACWAGGGVPMLYLNCDKRGVISS